MSATDGLCDGNTRHGCGNPARYVIKREDSPPTVDLTTGCGQHLSQLVTAASREGSRVVVVVIPTKSEAERGTSNERHA